MSVDTPVSDDIGNENYNFCSLVIPFEVPGRKSLSKGVCVCVCLLHLLIAKFSKWKTKNYYLLQKIERFASNKNIVSFLNILKFNFVCFFINVTWIFITRKKSSLEDFWSCVEIGEAKNYWSMLLENVTVPKFGFTAH